jgi:hypothetical protein
MCTCSINILIIDNKIIEMCHFDIFIKYDRENKTVDMRLKVISYEYLYEK